MPLLEMRGISKHFGALVANDSIDLDVDTSEIHALLGENGAGKSTLMKILYGLYQPDAGTIRVNGKLVQLKSPADAIASGIGFVSQHFALVPTFTVAENILLGHEKRALLSREEMSRTVAATAQQYHFSVDPNAVVGDLAVGQQQRVEILKALYRGCRILILDEPTAVLTPRDTISLFETLRELQADGLSVVIITHKLDEVLAISQRVTVLRLGKVVGQVRTADTTAPALAQMMVGRQTVQVVRNTDHRPAQTVMLDAADLSLTDKRGVQVLNHVSLQVRAGEIAGIAGVAGNGQSELVAILTGMTKPDCWQRDGQRAVRPVGRPARVHAPQDRAHPRGSPQGGHRRPERRRQPDAGASRPVHARRAPRPQADHRARRDADPRFSDQSRAA